MPVQFEKNVLNFFPNTAVREMFEPFHRLKYASSAPFYDQLRLVLPKLVKEKGVRKACVLYQDDDYGLDIMRGGEAGLKALNMEYAEKTTYKRGATDFSSQVAKLKSSGCELVVLGTVIRESVGTVSEARKIGFNPVFIGTHAIYTDQLHKLGGKTMDGVYATHTAQHPYLDEVSPNLRFWANKYKTKFFNEEPTVQSVYGYQAIDAFASGAHKAGPNLTTSSFIKAMDSLVIPPDMFGTPEMRFGPENHLGSQLSRLSQIQDGRWRVVSDYVAP